MQPNQQSSVGQSLPPAMGGWCDVRETRLAGHLGLEAARPFAVGACVLRIEGDVVDRPSRYSVQVGVGAHVDVGPGDARGESGRHPWRFLNHSCAPNTAREGRDLLALRPIDAGQELTFDYEANEWDMAEPFVCACGADACRGWIRGYRHLSPVVREALRERTAAHLFVLAAGETADAPVR
jgi:hypothetical protein